MKRKALVSAFSLKAQEGSVKVITNIEKIQAKTKIIASLLKKLDLQGNCLLVISDKPVNNGQDVKLATRNIQRILVSRMANLNAFEIIKNRNILLSKEAIGVAK
ncbi:50S ribosomal protein L4 [Candidatus Curtissbacteria bacterium RIFOXYC2_FULL_41_11]|nr:MAG: 50S ribosomal protein L4 [Candidatus Curtissbacteria bacterium RIFOXYC2_FULL_41_11]